MKIAKEDFEILFWIHFMQFNNPKQLSQQMSISKEKAESKLKEFESKEWIEIEYREDEIYGSQLTEKGKEIWNDSEYDEWKQELGH